MSRRSKRLTEAVCRQLRANLQIKQLAHPSIPELALFEQFWKKQGRPNASERILLRNVSYTSQRYVDGWCMLPLSCRDSIFTDDPKSLQRKKDTGQSMHWAARWYPVSMTRQHKTTRAESLSRMDLIPRIMFLEMEGRRE